MRPGYPTSLQACSRTTSVHLRTCGSRQRARPRGTAGSFSDLAVGELGDDVEMAEVTGVLLQQVEQDPLQ